VIPIGTKDDCSHEVSILEALDNIKSEIKSLRFFIVLNCFKLRKEKFRVGVRHYNTNRKKITNIILRKLIKMLDKIYNST
jgi:hypothetical protein